MKFPAPIPIKEIARKIKAQIIGDETLLALGINEIHKVEKGDITFADMPKYFKKSLQSEASIILLSKKTDCPKGKALLLCDNPFHAYSQLVREHRPFQPLTANISETATIHPSSIIEPGAVIGHQVRIGEHCHIQANVVIAGHTLIGNKVTIQAGSVIGTDAFYFQKQANRSYEKWRSGGRVIIEDEVEIGANCTVNKGVSGDTVIGKGSQLDCQVHIGHGVVIGKNCLIAGQVGIGGKTILEDWVVVNGQAGLAQNIRIGKGAIIGAKSGVSKDLPGGKIYFGYPAAEVHAKQRELAALRHLPAFFKDFYQ